MQPTKNRRRFDAVPELLGPADEHDEEGLGLTFEYNDMRQLRRVLNTDTQAVRHADVAGRRCAGIHLRP